MCKFPVADDPMGFMDQGADGTEPMRFIPTRIALVSVHSDRLRSSQAQATVGDDAARLFEHEIGERLSHGLPPLLRSEVYGWDDSGSTNAFT